MCGRYEFDPESGSPAVQRLLGRLRGKWPDLMPVAGKREVCPGEKVAALVAGEGAKAALLPLQWGMVAGNRLVINARAETVASRPMFREAFRGRRCALLATGFYEWSPAPEHKKVLFRLQGAQEMCLAGIYDADGRFAVVTLPAEAPVAAIHPRMPLVLHLSDLVRWLTDETYARHRLLSGSPPLAAIE